MKSSEKILLILIAGLVLTSCRSYEKTDIITDLDTTVISEKQTELVINNEENTERSDDLTQEAIVLEESPVFVFDETDELMVKGQEFAESYAKCIGHIYAVMRGKTIQI